MTWVHLTNISGNRKVGPIKVTTSDKESCPSECGIADECYASGGPLAIHWNKVREGERGDNWDGFVDRVNGSAKTNCGDIIRQATYHLIKMVNLTPISVKH